MDKLKAAFDGIRADETMKASVLRGVSARASRRPMLRSAVAVAACLALLSSSLWLYLTPTAHISIDIDPALELAVNRFDRVISASGSNSAGWELVTSLELVNLNYADAVDRILDSEPVTELLDAGELLSVGVLGPQGEQTDRILSDVEGCSGESYLSDACQAAQAREHGLSNGKYRAYLELQALDPSVTAEQVQGMTMRQIRDWIESLRDSAEDTAEPTQPGHHGHGNGR